MSCYVAGYPPKPLLPRHETLGWRATPLHVILYEASLELVPRELWEHPSVYKSAWKRGKRPQEVLLDASLHHQAIRAKGLEEAEKRGRPDVVHFEMLEVLSSPLAQEHMIDFHVHTIGDYVIEVDIETRLPRNYNRFVGLMEQLFTVGRVPPDAEKPLMTIRPMTLRSLIRLLKPRRVYCVAYAEEAEPVKLREFAREVLEAPEETALLLPGFPHGVPRRETLEVATRVVRPAYPKRLEPWSLVSHVLAALAIEAGLV